MIDTEAEKRKKDAGRKLVYLAEITSLLVALGKLIEIVKEIFK